MLSITQVRVTSLKQLSVFELKWCISKTKGLLKTAIKMFYQFGLIYILSNIKNLGPFLENKVPYTCHHNPLLIRNHSRILTIHKARSLRKKLLKKSFFTFKKRVEKIQTTGYNGVCTVHQKSMLSKYVNTKG